MQVNLKEYKYIKSGEVLWNIAKKIEPQLSFNSKKELIDFMLDLARADELVERIAMKNGFYNEALIYIKKYTNKGYKDTYLLFQADLKWNREKSLNNSIELSKTIANYIFKNILGFYDKRLEALIIASNLLDDIFDLRKDNNFSMKKLLEFSGKLFEYSRISLPLILYNFKDLLSLTFYVLAGRFESEYMKKNIFKEVEII